jgi:DNA-binding CsgD family transcriptional regulator
MGAVGVSRARARCRERLAQLAGSTAPSDDIRLEAIAELSRAVGFGQWCWTVADPGPGYCTQGLADMTPVCLPSVPRQYLAEETDRFSVTRQVRRSRVPAGTLSALTGGDLARSTRWDECLRPAGLGDELAVACRDSYGFWGLLLARREIGDRHFTEDELALVTAVAVDIARLTRRVLARPASQLAIHRPGIVIVDRELRFLSWTDSVPQWLDQMIGPTGMLCVQVVAAQIVASGFATHCVRMRTVTGAWLALDLAPLEGAVSGHYAITLRAATQREVLDVTGRAYALTGRERQLVRHVVDGRSTQQIAHGLGITEYTVKDHLKSVFRKVNVASRGELGRVLTG